MNVKERIENTLHSYTKTLEESDGVVDDQSIEMLVDALNLAYGEIDRLELLSKDRENLAYKYMERYSFLRANISPLQLANNLNIPFTPFPDKKVTMADYTGRIDSYVEGGLLRDRVEACNQNGGKYV